MEESAVERINTTILEHVAMLAQLSVVLQAAVLELVRMGFVCRRQVGARLLGGQEQRAIPLLIVPLRERMESVAPRVVASILKTYRSLMKYLLGGRLGRGSYNVVS
jgi:hypothetical protein